MFQEKPLGLRLKIVSNLFNRRLTQISVQAQKHHDCNITGLHGWIISYIAQHPDEDIYQKDIEKLLAIRRSSTTNILQLMEKGGLIERVSVSHDARLKKIVLTEKGLSHHEYMLKQIDEVETELIYGISAKELAQFNATLDKIYANIKDDNKDDFQDIKCESKIIK